MRDQGARPDISPFNLAGVRLDDPGPSLSIDDIQSLEQAIDVDLPPEYRWLLLQSNGGKPSPSTFPNEPRGEMSEDDDDGDRSEVTLTALFRLREADRDAAMRNRADVHTVEEMALDWYSDRFEVPPGIVVIGELEGYGHEGYGFLLLGCEGKDCGRLFAAAFGVEPLGLTLPQLFAAMGAGAKRPQTPGRALIEAIGRRDLDGVRAALAAGARATKFDSDGNSPALLACETGFDEAVIAMAEAGVKVGKLLDCAAMTGRTALVRRLLDRGKRPSKKVLNELLCSYPDLFADPDLVKELVAHGADLAAESHGMPMPLIMAARSGSLEALELVLDAGPSPHFSDPNLGSLLHAAATDSPGAAEVIRYLLGLGVRPNQTDVQGHTALHRAVMAGNLDAAKTLIDAGEDLHARHPFNMPGAGPAGASHMMEMLQGLLDRSDGPPPPDPSTPLGASLAQAQAAIEQKLEGLSGLIRQRIDAIAAGDWGKGPPAAELARSQPHLQAMLAELEDYAARKRR
jgi:ankyrin repeat protein